VGKYYDGGLCAFCAFLEIFAAQHDIATA